MASGNLPKRRLKGLNVDAHITGLCCVTFDTKGDCIVTGGADGLVKIFTLLDTEGNPAASCSTTVEASPGKGITAVAMSPRGDRFATGSMDQRVKLWEFPSGKFVSSFTRFQLPVRTLAFNSTGSILAAAGDEGIIKLIQVDTNSVAAALPAKVHRGPIISLAFDPKDELIASADTEGVLVIWEWDASDSLWRVRDNETPRVPLTDPGDLQQLQIAWQPGNGIHLATPDDKRQVQLLDRETVSVMDEQECLKGAHTSNVSVLSWSPNGRYVATSATDGQVIVWNTADGQDLDCQKVSAFVCGLSWKPNGNMLAMVDIEGQMNTWNDPVPDHMDSPFEGAPKPAGIDRRIVNDFKDEVGGEAFTPSGDDDDLADDLSAQRKPAKNFEASEHSDSGDSGIGFRRHRKKRIVKGRQGVSRPPPDTMSDDGDSLQYEQKEYRQKPKKPSADELVHHVADSGTPMQVAFQSGATDPIPGKKRFLTYSLLGCITTKEDNGIAHVEIDFHDMNFGFRVPPMADYYGFTMAALGDKGSVFANPRRGEKSPSTFLYRPFNSWAANSEWSMRFSGDEEVTCVAIGNRWAAASTSLQMLRIFSEAGVQRYVLSLSGPVVTMAGHVDFLAVVTHAGSPLPCGDQVMEFTIYNIREQRKVNGGRLLLSPKANLAWLGFSENGNLSTFDSQGIVRVYSPDYGGCWTPLFSSSADKKDTDVKHWIVGLNETQLFFVLCKLPETHPQVIPKPVHTIMSPSVPLAHSDLGADALEKDLLLKSLLLSQHRAKADEAIAEGREDENEEEKILTTETEVDKCLLRLIAAACKADKLTRACDLATMLSLHRSLEGAVKLAISMRLPALAERLHIMLEERLKEEESVLPIQTPSPQRLPSQTNMRHNQNQICHNGKAGGDQETVKEVKTVKFNSRIEDQQQSREQSLTPKALQQRDVSQRSAFETKTAERETGGEGTEEKRTGEAAVKASNPFSKTGNPFSKKLTNDSGAKATSLLGTLKNVQSMADSESNKRQAMGGVNSFRPQKTAKV